MAFPTSGLTNNQVHKEGNRAFVYDSTLGVWDQVKEVNRTVNKIYSPSVGGNTIFPKGQVINVQHNTFTGNADTTSSQYTNTGYTAIYNLVDTANIVWISAQIWCGAWTGGNDVGSRIQMWDYVTNAQISANTPMNYGHGANGHAGIETAFPWHELYNTNGRKNISLEIRQLAGWGGTSRVNGQHTTVTFFEINLDARSLQ